MFACSVDIVQGGFIHEVVRSVMFGSSPDTRACTAAHVAFSSRGVFCFAQDPTIGGEVDRVQTRWLFNDKIKIHSSPERLVLYAQQSEMNYRSIALVGWNILDLTRSSPQCGSHLSYRDIEICTSHVLFDWGMLASNTRLIRRLILVIKLMIRIYYITLGNRKVNEW